MDRDPFDLVGDVLDGQFRVDSFEGEGDLSVVYKGHHLGVDAPVAIKCLNLPATLDPALARPLVEGFKEASRLHYRLARGNLNIAQSIASGTTLAPRTGTVVPYLVREWFDGESLASDLEARRQQKRRGRSVDQARALLEGAFDGIAFAHRENEVHLSVNPSNLFLARRAESVSLKVLDFGVARTMNDLVTGMPAGAGTAGLRLLFPAYAAPEQFDKTVGDLGPRTDVYSLALVVMEVLSDRVVMAETETGALVARALDAHRRPAPEAHGLKLPKDLDRALSRAVERSPDRRQKDAGELWDDLKNATRSETLRPTFSRSFSPPPSSAVAAMVAPAPASSGSLPVPPPSGSLPPVPPPSGPLPPPPQRPRAHTLVGIGAGGRPMVAGAVAPPLAVMTHTARPPDVAPAPGLDGSVVPYVTTRPLSFEPLGGSRAPPPPHATLEPAPPPAAPVVTPPPSPALA
ncbi:MAG TPA: protein kinase, partial [Polyangiaceae bacterium]|nr:protein kinase [Polyangiaceae bacterium]